MSAILLSSRHIICLRLHNHRVYATDEKHVLLKITNQMTRDSSSIDNLAGFCKFDSYKLQLNIDPVIFWPCDLITIYQQPLNPDYFRHI